MISLSGTASLQHFQRQLARAPSVFPKAEAAACNKAGRAVRMETKKITVQRTGLPAGPVGRRIYLKRADARKPKRFAKVTGYLRKFSASYRRATGKTAGALIARQMRRGVRVGSHTFTGAWVGYSKRYGRKYVGRRTGGSASNVIYPSIDIGRIIDKTAKRIADSKGARILERELGAQVEKRLDRHFR